MDITYADGGTLHLLLGAEEPIGGGRYLMEEGGGAVLLMKNSRSIRFTMPVEKYIDYIIIPPENTASELDALQDITFSGRALENPIVLKAVLPERADMQLVGLSFGALTHVVTEPGLHEANATTLLEVAEDLLGLISEGVVDYNCTEEALAAYGFDDPYLCIEFDYKNGADAPVEHYKLLVSQWEDGYIVKMCIRDRHNSGPSRLSPTGTQPALAWPFWAAVRERGGSLYSASRPYVSKASRASRRSAGAQ